MASDAAWRSNLVQRKASSTPTAMTWTSIDKQDIFQVVLATVNNGGNLEQILVTTRRRTLSKNRVKEIVAYMVSLATPPGKAATYTGAAVVPIDSLFDSTEAGPHPEANPRQVLNEVDVISAWTLHLAGNFSCTAATS